MDSQPVDLHDPAFLADPYPFYARLREEDPVSWFPFADERGMWLVTRYEAAQWVLRDLLFRKNPRDVLPVDRDEPDLPSLLDMDPPDHTRVRSLVNRAFTPRVVAALVPRITEITDELLDAADGTVDLVDALAFPLPITVIAEMLGVPGDDRDQFRAWSTDFVGAIDAVGASEERRQRAMAAGLTLAAYFGSLIEARRDRRGDDLISGLLAARDEEDRLSDAELIGMLILLLVAGHETTVGLIGNGMVALLNHPDQLALLRDDPALAESAVEEMLRFDPPVQRATFRYAGEPTTIDGVTIDRGQQVSAVIAAANRDPRQFPDPDRFDIRRDPNRHLGFGRGSHFCLGAPLARLEARIAFGRLLERFATLEPAGEVEWRPSTFLRGPARLPITVR
jgi:cytochrome P450